MKPYEYAKYDALDLKGLLDAGEVTAHELHEIAIKAIDRLNPTLNFMTAFSPEEADRALAHLNPEAPFAGIPFLVKEGVGMQGLPMEFGSRLAKGLICEADFELVTRLKSTGVITLGSTNIPEFANACATESVMYGPARNPWNIDHSCGGSSGGAAAAVAAGVVPMAQGSDGGGSIRIPAHCCGVFGLMPSRGRNPCGPATYGTNFGFLRQHVLTRSVRDSAAMLDGLQGSEHGGLFRIEAPQRPFLDEVDADPGRLKIAFSMASPSAEAVHPDCVAAVEKALQHCQDLGHHVEEIAPCYNWEMFIEAFTACWGFNFNFIQSMAEQTGREIGPDTLEHSSLLIADYARSLTSARLNAMFNQLHAINYQVECFFADWDILITPACLTPAPPLGNCHSNDPELRSFDEYFDHMITKFAPFTPIFNANGQPAMSVPIHHTEEGLPVGIQCAARVGDEATLIRLASQFEQVCSWKNRQASGGLFHEKVS